MSKTGAKALKEMRRRLDGIIDDPHKGIVLLAVLVDALVTDVESLHVKVVVQPYHQLGNNAPALGAWDEDYPDDVIKVMGSDDRAVQEAVDVLLLKAARRLMKVKVKRLRDRAVRTLPTDPAPH